jgi:CRISPR-associated protein Cmr3
MNAWLDGAAPAPDDFVHSSELWDEEIRTGVGLKSDNRTSEMSMLYTFAFVRLMPGVSIGFELSGEGLKLPADTSLKTPADISLGGEGRGGTLLDGPPMPVQSRAPRGRFSLYLATPAIFDNGCIPDSFDPASNHGSLAGVACRLIAPVCRGFDLIGGWDLAAGRPRPLRRALPAGTVLLFESTGAEAGTERPFMDPGLLKQGFGLSLVGSST